MNSLGKDRIGEIYRSCELWSILIKRIYLFSENWFNMEGEFCSNDWNMNMNGNKCLNILWIKHLDTFALWE